MGRERGNGVAAARVWVVVFVLNIWLGSRSSRWRSRPPPCGLLLMAMKLNERMSTALVALNASISLEDERWQPLRNSSGSCSMFRSIAHFAQLCPANESLYAIHLSKVDIKSVVVPLLSCGACS